MLNLRYVSPTVFLTATGDYPGEYRGSFTRPNQFTFTRRQAHPPRLLAVVTRLPAVSPLTATPFAFPGSHSLRALAAPPLAQSEALVTLAHRALRTAQRSRSSVAGRTPTAQAGRRQPCDSTYILLEANKWFIRDHAESAWL